jgi:hypothetical protein
MRRGIAPQIGGGALQERQRTAVVSALSVATADSYLRDALPEAAVPIIDAIGLPDIFEELVGFEETVLVEHLDSAAASLLGGAHDLSRFSGVDQFIPASMTKQATVTIPRGNAGAKAGAHRCGESGPGWKVPRRRLVGEAHPTMSAVAEGLVARVAAAAKSDRRPSPHPVGCPSGVTNLEIALDQVRSVPVYDDLGIGHA